MVFVPVWESKTGSINKLYCEKAKMVVSLGKFDNYSENYTSRYPLDIFGAQQIDRVACRAWGLHLYKMKWRSFLSSSPTKVEPKIPAMQV